MNAAIVGKSAKFIADMAGINVEENTTLLVAPLRAIGDKSPLSAEILAPIIAFYVADDFDHAIKICMELNFYGGIGHTVSLFANNETKIKQFSLLMNAGRIVVNTPSSYGAVGAIYNHLYPSLTLGCGSGGKNITTDNITARNLLNIQRIARRRLNERFFSFDTSLYLDEKNDVDLIETIFNKNY